jgi:hypothetical protein
MNSLDKTIRLLTKEQKQIKVCCGYIDAVKKESIPCDKVNIDGVWRDYKYSRKYPHLSHGYCPDCYNKMEEYYDN